MRFLKLKDILICSSGRSSSYQGSGQSFRARQRHDRPQAHHQANAQRGNPGLEGSLKSFFRYYLMMILTVVVTWGSKFRKIKR